MSAKGDRGPLLRTHYPVVVALSLYALGVLAVRPWADLPLADDWVYALDVVRSVRDGGLRFLGIEGAWGIPQVWLGTLLRPERQIHLQLRLLSMAAAALSIVASYLLLRRVTGNKPLLLLLLAGLAAYPPFFLCSLTFMTDSLFLFLVLLAVLLLGKAADARSPAWLLLAAVACALSGLQRQFGFLLVVPLAAISLASLRRQRAFALVGLLGAAAMILVYAATLRWWDAHAGLPFRPPLARPSLLSTQVYLGHLLLFFSGLLVVPAFLSLRPSAAFAAASAPGSGERAWKPARFLLLSLLAAEAVYRLVRDVNAPFAGNFLSSYGVFQEGDVLAGAREVNITLPVRALASAVGFAPWAMLLLWLRPRLRLEELRSFPARQPQAFAAISFGVLYAGVVGTRAIFFDRYALPLVPALLCACALLLDRAPPGRRTALGLLAATATLAFTVATGRDYFSWNAAKWTLAGRAAQRLASVEELDGGYEWNGWNGKILTAHPYFASETARYVLSFSPLPDARILDAEPWHSLWPPRERRIHLLERTR